MLTHRQTSSIHYLELVCNTSRNTKCIHYGSSPLKIKFILFSWQFAKCSSNLFIHNQWQNSSFICVIKYVHYESILKLYCGYLYTRPCMINRIWGLKQLWLQVNGHAWFHLHGIHLPVRNDAEGVKNSKWKYSSPAGFEHTPRHDTD